jgi:2-iminobutanoate/2-iminopropanoate deaminase
VKQQLITNKGAAPSGSYSQGLKVGDFVFVSGQGPLHPETGEVVGTTIEEQTAATLENINAILAAGGASLGHVVKVTVHLSSLKLFDDFDKTYATFFSDPKPTRTTVGSELAGIMIEVDVIAYTGKG